MGAILDPSKGQNAVSRHRLHGQAEDHTLAQRPTRFRDPVQKINFLPILRMRFTASLILVPSVLGEWLRSEDTSSPFLPLVLLVAFRQTFARRLVIGLGVWSRGPRHESASLLARFVRVSDIRGPVCISDALLSDTAVGKMSWPAIPFRSVRPPLGLCGRFTKCFLAEVHHQEDPNRCDRGVRAVARFCSPPREISLELFAEFHQPGNCFECPRVGRCCSS